MTHFFTRDIIVRFEPSETTIVGRNGSRLEASMSLDDYLTRAAAHASTGGLREQRLDDMRKIFEAMDALVKILASCYPQVAFLEDAHLLTVQPQPIDSFTFLAERLPVKRNARMVPMNLCGLIELVLRAAKYEISATNLPHQFQLHKLSSQHWATLKIAAVERRMTSHALLTIWVAMRADPKVAPTPTAT